MRILIVSIILCLLTSTVTAQTAEEARNLETLKRWGEIWNNGKYDLLPDTVMDKHTRHEPHGTRKISRKQYLDEIKFFREVHHVRFKFLKVSADKDWIWVLWSVKSKNPETGEDNFGRGVHLYRFENGMIAETWWMGTLNQGAWPE